MTHTITLVVVGLLAAVCQAQDHSEFSKLPAWPSDGRLSGDLQNQYVFRDARTEEIVLAIPTDRANPSSHRTIYRYRPQNQVDPQIGITISRALDGHLVYRYVIANGSGARQPIDAWTLVVPAADADLELNDSRWLHHRLAGAKVQQSAHTAAPPGDAAYWSRSTANGLEAPIAPGQRAVEFLVTASYLPGFTTAYVQGGPPLALPGELSFDVGQQLAPLMKMAQSTRPVLTIGPRFAPDASKGIVAADYAQGLQELAQRGYLTASGSFCRTAQEILTKCATPASSVCLTADRERALMQSSSTSLEKDIADALRVALK
jgi:hypothetical protein